MRFVLCYYQLVCAFLKERVRSQRSEAQLHFINAKHSLRYESGFTYSQPKPKQQKQTAIFPKNGLLWCSYKEGISLCGSEGGGILNELTGIMYTFWTPVKRKLPLGRDVPLDFALLTIRDWLCFDFIPLKTNEMNNCLLRYYAHYLNTDTQWLAIL